MDQTTYSIADRQLEKLAEIIEQLLASESNRGLKDALVALSRALGARYSVDLDVVVHVYDDQRERTLPLLTTGLSTAAEEEPYRTWSDCSPQRYVTDGEIQVVPHDRCPRCWDVWDFKFKNRVCSNCGAALGENVKVLIDNDVCPHCEEGTVSASSPRCEKCGFVVDPKLVAWG